MQSNPLLLSLQQVLSPESVSVVFKSLLTDPLLRTGLQDSAFLKEIVAGAGDHPASWSPAELALAALGGEANAKSLSAISMPAPERALRQRALQTYEDTLRSAKRPTSIEEAGLLALALRERRRLTQSWKGMASEMASTGGDAYTALAIWQTPLAVLFGLVPDPVEMLEALLPQKKSWPAFALIGHALLANPLAFEECKTIFARILRRLGLAEQVDWLIDLSGRGEARMAAQLAAMLLEERARNGQEAKVVDLSEITPVEAMNRAHELELLARLHALAGQGEQGLSLLISAREAARYWLAGLSARLADQSARLDHPDLVFPAVESLDWAGASAALPDSVQLSLGKHVHAKALLESLPPETIHPLVQVAQAGIAAHQGDRTAARDMARAAVDRMRAMRAQKQPQQELLTPSSLADWEPAGTVQTLLDLDLLEEAFDFARWALETRPADVSLLELVCEALQRLGNLAGAIESAQSTLALDPAQPKHHRRLAGLLATKGEWEQSFIEREKVVRLLDDAGEEDWLEYAGSALNSGRSQQTIEACTILLDRDANHGLANAWMGKALADQDRLKEAIQFLSRATLLIPDEAMPWLVLSQIYIQNGDTQRALEALRAGVLSVPDSPEINYSLAEACLSAGSLSEALPFLKKASGLIPESLDVTLQLGRTLFSLGHLAEARQVLAKARQKWPTEPDLAYASAEVLLAFGEREKAIPALEVALQKNPPVLDWHICYAETLIGDWRQLLTGAAPIDFGKLVNAQQSLEKALALAPDDFRALLLLAEALGARGRSDAAVEIYKGLVELAESEAPEWRWRVQGGFGKAALSLGQTETALAALQEATQAQPDNVFFQRLLAQAYFAADLPQEALQVARYAQRLAPDDLDTLSWFAGMAVELGEEYEAIDALQCATQLAPEHPDYWLRLSGLLLQLGDLSSARAALESLVELKAVEPTHLRQAAYAYLRMQDPISALSCLRAAVDRCETPESGLLFEVARLTLQTGDPDGALESLQAAAERTPEDVSLHVFQSDLLRVLSRPQAALACLERALKLKESGEGRALGNQKKTNYVPVAAWQEVLDDQAGIHARFALLLRELGNLPSALYHAQTALDLRPDETAFQWMAASLSESLLKRDVAAKLLDLPETAELNGAVFNGRATPQETEARVGLTAQKAGHALAQDRDERAAAFLSQGLLESPENPHLLLLQARIFARQGDTQTAKVIYEKALELCEESFTGSPTYHTSLDLSKEYLRERALWLAQAAFDLQRWDEAVRWSEKAVLNDPFNPQAYLERARILTLCAERQHLCAALKSIRHAPGPEALTPERAEQFEQALESAGKLSHAEEITRWQLRGRAAFQTTGVNVRAFMTSNHKPSEAAALSAALRRLNNLPVSIQVARSAPGRIDTLLELSLSLLSGEPEKAMEVAQQAAEAAQNPLCQVAVALAAETAGVFALAFSSIENALHVWPDEPEWHAWAAELATVAGPYGADIQHWREAVDLDAQKTGYVLSLARAYLYQQLPLMAVETLNKPYLIQLQNPEILLTLAEAYQQAGSLDEALAHAEHSIALDAASPRPLLVCGEIALAMDRTDLAEEYAQVALQRDPKRSDVILFTSKVLKQQERWNEALDVIEHGLPGVTAPAPLLVERARLVRKIKGPQQALSLIQDILRQDAANVEALGLLAHAQFDSGDLKGAEATIHTGLRLDPNQPELNLLMGSIQHMNGQLDQAIHYLSEAIRQKPSIVEAYVELGKTYQERREDMQALRIYQQAVLVAPEDGRPYHAAALILRESKDYLGAEAMLRKAAKLSPEDLSIRRQLGAIIALNLVHNSQEAKTTL